MEQKTKTAIILIMLAMVTLCAFMLRSVQSATQAGPLAWGSVIVLIMFAAFALLQKKNRTYDAANGKGAVRTVLSCLAAIVVFSGALLRWKEEDHLLQVALMAATALCWAVTALLRQRGKRVSAWLFMIPAVFFGVELIDQFRTWSSDPQILDYCYELLALIGTMCAAFHLGGFCFERGQRRLTVFFCMSAIFFGGAALANASGTEMAVQLACMLWLGVNLSLLLRTGR